MHAPRRVVAALVAALAASAAAGCGSAPRYKPVPLTPARGKVVTRGGPAAGAVVRLHAVPPRGDGLSPVGRAGADGVFALTTYEDSDGAPEGEYRVTISWPERQTGSPGPPVDKLDGNYSKPDKSRWTVTIRAGENTLPDFEVALPEAAKAAPKRPTRKMGRER